MTNTTSTTGHNPTDPTAIGHNDDGAPVTTDGVVIGITHNDDDGTVTIHTSTGINRTLDRQHPTVIWVIDASTPDMWHYGTGRGNPRADVIHHGMTTSTGRDRTFACTGHLHDGARLPYRRFPTIHRPTAGGRVRVTTECRACRDDRYAIGAATGTTPTRDAMANAAAIVTGIARSFA